MRRIFSLDIFRGLALMFTVFFHTSVYNFANIDKLDFSNPPITVVVISFLVLWGGIFVVYSALINSAIFVSRFEKHESGSLLKISFFTGFVLIVCHYLLIVVLGRWNVDFVNNQPNLSMVAGTLRQMKVFVPVVSKFFEGSSLSIIGFNLMVVNILLYFLGNKGGFKRDLRNYSILVISGTIIMLLSFVRISFFPLTDYFISQKNYIFATLSSFLIANPYPIIPYLAYGLFGALLGLMFYKKHTHLLKRLAIPLGVFFTLYGLIGMTQFPKTISKADYFWYFKTHFELGLFLIVTSILLIYSTVKNRYPKSVFSVPYWFSRVCLSVYLLETFISELLRYPMFKIFPSWDQTINGCLIFGGVNILVWSLILFLWQKNNFKHSLEYYWILLFKRIGKSSTKLDELNNSNSNLF